MMANNGGDSDSDGSISLGPIQEVEGSQHSTLRGYNQADSPAEAPVSIWAPGQLGPGPYRITYQVPDLIESDSDSCISLGPLHEAESSQHSILRDYNQADRSAEAPVSIWAPRHSAPGPYRIIYQAPDLIESDSDSSISLGPLHEAVSSQHSILRGHSQADSSAEYLAEVTEQNEAVEAGPDLSCDIRQTYSENRCSTPTREDICDTKNMDYWNAHGYNKASNIGGPVDTSSDFPLQSSYTSSNITTSLFDPHAYMSEPEENDERAMCYDPNGDEGYGGMWAYVDLAPLARQLPDYRSWNHDDIQLYEDADTRFHDLESEHEHRDVIPWYQTNLNFKQPLLSKTGAVHTRSTRLIIKHVRLI